MLDDPPGRTLPVTAPVTPGVIGAAPARVGARAGRRVDREVAFAGPSPIAGALLLEALVATLVLALATLGFLGLTAVALRGSADARWRADAAALAASTVARMSVAAPATLVADYDASQGGAGFRAFASLAQRLPGVTATVNAPEIAVTSGSSGSATASVRLRWQAPNESAPHRYAIEDAVIAW